MTAARALLLVVVVAASAWPSRADAQDSRSIPVVANDRPMRFVLTGGAQVIGTRVGEDAETWTVQTASGLVRVRKIDVSFMDFRTGAPVPPPPIAGPPPVVMPVQPAPPPPPPARPRRKSLMTAGISGLVATYAITAITGSIISTWDSDATWMLMPVAGPLLYYQAGDIDKDYVGLLLLSTLFQGASLVAMIIGIVVYSNSGEDVPVAAASAPRIALTPVLSPQVQGLRLSLSL